MISLNLRWNVSAGYVSQIYSALIGIVMVPMYLHYMGTEAYGLIGMYTVVQLCVQSLDLGITPTLTREAARTNSGASPALLLRQLLRTFELIFLIVGIVTILVVWTGSEYLSTKWINGVHISAAEIKRSLILMAFVAWARWCSGLYRGVVYGFERQVWQSGMNMAIATAHSIMVIPYLAYVGATPTCFFAYQSAISICELAILMIKAYRTIPASGSREIVSIRFRSLGRIFHFSAAIAATTTLWIAVTQVDRVLLSRMLSLSDFGLYSLATVVAGGVTTLSIPLGSALLPRLTGLEAAGRDLDFVAVYRNATQFTAVIALSASLFLGIFSPKILWVWTGSPSIAANAAGILSLYALGNGIMALISLPYYLQFAKGRLSLHLVGTLVFMCILVPAVFLLTRRFGAAGAGMAWLGSNFLYLMFWIPIIHHVFLGRFHLGWLVRDIFLIGAGAGFMAVAARLVVVWPGGRLADGAVLVCLAFLIVAAASAASSFARRIILESTGRLFGAFKKPEGQL